MTNFQDFKNKVLKNKEIKRFYDELGPEFELIHQLIEKRIKAGLTQTELAQKIGTKQSAISRLERGDYNPSVAFLRKVAEALGSELRISLPGSRSRN
ncbi:MAG: Helix-turn-helix domain protein [Candidatus Falkowbacteria bacterium GW2011_GWC2_38_22]|uniref:Helix-turn-helix domain protein n=1 Tax=Candidatus Falkowbacteria bacterium GW2011_GWE1_38_31 TaxID=1618638 RepID=A0A0G0MBY0_9BACT|nr:MAG: Helix-turn-helix domain protein [Candidatus Falkowbacteria bacterium GW2011_GWF2_38_1205]KKQ61835.1 MAG: Helix-turn-helix domain protein [Candidatus Falkowbacteria bacterium GW2011_GWC2_38_22]KKQ64143.1 MAG: Helix-turn-helix domain protein [Candidatus Falkowbacteria bacterium GW2011_GWF1_38_22]KKQ66507.1 MAG: Helix-turn-helix domain protein [Candidatus Falkowbacteria bacterium GW2011_GWE2_38_254]KKQ71249.1 MAG: Helix-turn-helix domain protein [Candidatus Falkowbacteria bacterium GW2011_